MADESTLLRIADLARTLRAACPAEVANLRNAAETLRWCRDEPEHTTDRLTADALHAYTAYRALVDEYAGMLRELLSLVYRHLPGEGSTPQELSRVDEPLDRWDWDAAAGELQGIEVAALAATNTPAIAGNVEAGNGSTSKTQRRASTNARMLDVLTRTPDCRGWTVSRWSAELKCSRGAIHAAPTWKELKAARDLIAAEHATTKRRRSAGRRKT
jgi:hypothetical protein